MSNFLNRISLDLVNLEAGVEYERKKKNRVRRVWDLIPANRRIVEANRKSESSGASRHNKNIGVVKNKKCSVRNRVSTAEKIQRLLVLSSNHVDVNTAQELFNRAVEKRPILEDNKPRDEEKTAFTEDDFNNFAREYSIVN